MADQLPAGVIPLPQTASALPPGIMPLPQTENILPSGVTPLRANEPSGDGTFAPYKQKPQDLQYPKNVILPVRGDLSQHKNLLDLADKISSEEGVSPAVARAMMRLEVGNDTNPEHVVNSAGKVGPMQVDPDTFREYFPQGNIQNPAENIRGGIRYFKRLQHDYWGDPVLAAAAYNMGPIAFNKWITDPTHDIKKLPLQTQQYMMFVAANMKPHEIPSLPIMKTTPAPTASPKPVVGAPGFLEDPTLKPLESILAQGSKYITSQRQAGNFGILGNQDPLVGHYNFLEHWAGHMDLPFEIYNATQWDKKENPGLKDFRQGKHFQEVISNWATNPGGIGLKYGLNSSIMLKEVYADEAQRDIAELKKNGVKDPTPYVAAMVRGKIIKALSEQPWINAGVTFFEEFFNPIAWVEGKALNTAAQKLAAIGKSGLVGLAHSESLASGVYQGAKDWKSIYTSPEFLDIINAVGDSAKSQTQKVITKLFPAIAPFARLTADHGEGPRNVIAATGQRMGSSRAHTLDLTKDMYGDTNYPEQLTIERLRQYKTPEQAAQLHDDYVITNAREGKTISPQPTGQAVAQTDSKLIDRLRITPQRLVELGQKAELAREATRQLTALRLFYGHLQPEDVFFTPESVAANPKGVTLSYGGKSWHFAGDPGSYFPASNLYEHPLFSIKDMMEEYNIHTPEGAMGPSLMSKQYKTIDEAMSDPNFRHDDYSPATQMFNYMNMSMNRAIFEDGMRNLERLHPDVVRQLPQSMNELKDLLKTGKWLPLNKISVYDHLVGLVEMPPSASTYMKNLMVSPAYAEFLTNSRGLSRLLGVSAVARGAQRKMPLSQFVDGLESAIKKTILANPAFHPFSNISPAFGVKIGAGPTQLGTIIASYIRAYIGFAATVAESVDDMGLSALKGIDSKVIAHGLDAVRETLEEPFLRGMADHAEAFEESLKAGAQAESVPYRSAFGKDIAKILTRNDLPLEEKIDQMLTKLDQWNSKSTFGPRGEQSFATTYYATMRDKFIKAGEEDLAKLAQETFDQPALETTAGREGALPGTGQRQAQFKYSDEDIAKMRSDMQERASYAAGWATREAMGNYRNIDPDSLFAKLLMFASWFKTSAGFWGKQFLVDSTFPVAVTDATLRQRQAAGDPTVYGPYPKQGLGFYGSDYQLAMPFLTASKLMDIGMNLLGVVKGEEPSGDVIEEATSFLASRTRPTIGVGFDVLGTTMGSAAEPGTYRGYTTMWNKYAPPAEQRNQLAESIGIELTPLPFPFFSRDALRTAMTGGELGFSERTLQDIGVQLSGVGYLGQEKDPVLQQRLKNAYADYEKNVRDLQKQQRGPHPRPDADYRAQWTKYYDNYQNVKNTILNNRKAELARQSGALPPGTKPLPPGTPP